MKRYYILKIATATENNPFKSFVGCERLYVFGKGRKLLYALNNDVLFGKPFKVEHIKQAIAGNKKEQDFGFTTIEDVTEFLNDSNNGFKDNTNPKSPWTSCHTILEVDIGG